jgi:hypothetical protein
VLALTSEISSLLGMPVLLELLSLEMICGLPRIREEFFARLER